MEAETILILPFVVATAVAIAVQRLDIPYVARPFHQPRGARGSPPRIRAKVERDRAALDELHLERNQLRAEEEQLARRHLLQVERGAVSDAFHRGVLNQAMQEKLRADIDTRLLRLESGEIVGPVDDKPCPECGDGHNAAEAKGQASAGG